MVGIQRIGGTPELANPQPMGLRATKQQQSSDVGQDEVEVSSEALWASRAVGMFDESQEERERREQRITEVKDSLEKGLYKLQEVLLQVAARITKYVAESHENASDGTSGAVQSNV